MAKKPNIVDLLIERYFGPTFEEQNKISTGVIECLSTSDFEKLKIDFESDPVQRVYAAANFSDPEAKKLTADRLNQIFDKLKPVRSAAGFF